MAHNVLIFSLTYYPKFVGGAEVAIKEITDNLQVGADTFHMITARFDTTLSKEERLGNVMVHRVGIGVRGADISQTHAPLFYLAKILFIPCAAWKGVALVRKKRITALWAMMTYMLFPIVLMRIAGVRLPYVLTLQEGDPFQHVFERPYILPFRPLLSWGFKDASVVQCISSYLASWVRDLAPGTPAVVIPNGVALQLFARQPEARERASMRESFGGGAGDTWLVHTGRLVHKNGLDTLVQALALLPKSVHLLLVGDGPEREALATLAQALGLHDRVRFVPYVAQHKLPAYLHACDIFIRPSRSEGMGNSFIEAFAAGIPVIGTPVGGIPDFLFDPERNPDRPPTGLFCEVNNPESIARQVKRLMDDQGLARELVANAQTLAKEKYDWNLIAASMQEEVFEVLCGTDADLTQKTAGDTTEGK